MNEQSPPMSPEQFRRVRQIFEQALDCPIAERGTFVAGACGNDLRVLNEVERMLAADGNHWRLLDGSKDRADDAALDRDQTCVSCAAPVLAVDRFCRACGTPVSPVGLNQEERFRAGTLFAGRFRIGELLGRGGMGEVYRADDLKLGQPVALKFLTALRSDSARARLYSEVSLARRISHPNVCRVYDVGETNGDLYLSMEYVDGEDLAALLKRIGRLPVDKGVEIGRKLCSALAAAHAKNVLHRDLKPGNIMIDGRGEVRIMDFGLAATTGGLNAHDPRSGTPHYMAPEQLAGREVTIRSDLYALGLVLYELFTGKPPFEAETIGELQRLREAYSIPAHRGLIPELEPALERAILQCLEPDAKMRPSSALELAKLLGDPLVAILAAGEMPSPEMVAKAGSVDALLPRGALALLASATLGLTATCILASHVQIVSRLPLEHPPEVLAAKARDIARNIGYAERPFDVAAGFQYADGYLEYINRAIPASPKSRMEQWNHFVSSGPYPVFFSYGQSPVPFMKSRDELGWTLIRPLDHWLDYRGAVFVHVDLDGRLLLVLVSPPATQRSQDSTHRQIDWSALFSAAHLDISRFASVEPQVTSLTLADARLAWAGVYPGPHTVPIRVEAASFRGDVTYFEVVFPWRAPVQQSSPPATSMLVPLMAVVILVARYNWNIGRGDPRGAWLIGLYTGLGHALYSILGSYNMASTIRLGLEPVALRSLALGAANATLYLAFEPWVRKLWPKAMTTWARVLAGNWKDPVVGRDLMVAVVGATFARVAYDLLQLAAISFGHLPTQPTFNFVLGFSLDTLMGQRFILSSVAGSFLRSLDVLAFFFVAFIARAVLKKTWLAALVYLLFWNAIFSWSLFVQRDWLGVVCWGIELSLVLGLILRFGLFAAVAYGFVSLLIGHALLTTEFTAWYGQGSFVVVVVVSVLVLIAFRLSLGGRPLFNVRRA